MYVNSSWGPTLAATNSPDLVAPGVRVGGIFRPVRTIQERA